MKLVAVLHNVRSIHNVGSIFRTADAAGVEKIYLCGITPGPLDRFKALRADFAKVALGGEKSVAWEAARTPSAVLRRLKMEGFYVVAVEQSRRAVPYYNAVRGSHDQIALVMGNEVRGLPPSVLALADAIAEIPMFGKKESLNVAVAFGVAAFGMRFGGRSAK